MCNTLRISLFSKHSKCCFNMQVILAIWPSIFYACLEYKVILVTKILICIFKFASIFTKMLQQKIRKFYNFLLFYIYRSNRSFNVSLQKKKKTTVRFTVFVSGKITRHLINYSEKLINWYPHNSLCDTQRLFFCFFHLNSYVSSQSFVISYVH